MHPLHIHWHIKLLTTHTTIAYYITLIYYITLYLLLLALSYNNTYIYHTYRLLHDSYILLYTILDSTIKLIPITVPYLYTTYYYHTIYCYYLLLLTSCNHYKLNYTITIKLLLSSHVLYYLLLLILSTYSILLLLLYMI